MPSPVGSSPAGFTDFSFYGGDTLAALLTGWYWGSLGSAVSLTYSFPWAVSDNATWEVLSGNNYTFSSSSVSINGTEPNREFRFALTPTQQAAVREALAQWANVASVRFTESPDTSIVVGDIRIAFTTVGGDEGGHAYYPFNSPRAGDIWLSGQYASDQLATMTKGTYGFYTLLHEIGHALGLKHPFEGSPRLDPAIDWLGSTVMSYNAWNRAEDPNHVVTTNF